MTKLQEIKNKVYCLKHSTDSTEEAMKKELVFGCQVEVDTKKWHVNGDFVAFDGNIFKLRVGIGGYCVLENFAREEFEILGTNISLADILMAIKKSGEYFCLMPSDDNNVDFLKVVEDGYEYLAEWDTSNDSLDWHAEHKPETIEFLHSIICK